MRTIAEINAEIESLRTELEGEVTEERLAAIECRQKDLADELKVAQEHQARAQRAANIRSMLIPGNPVNSNDDVVTRAQAFMQHRGGMVNQRALLLSGGQIAQPTGVEGINDLHEAQVSTLLDYVQVTDCTGMGVNRVAYTIEDPDAADVTEGETFTEGDMKFGYVDIMPSYKGLISYVSRTINNQTPLDYQSKVLSAASLALRKQATKDVVSKILASTLNTTLTVTEVDATTLDAIVLAYGGDEGIEGGAQLVLSKATLKLFAAVQGVNEYIPAYSIVPDIGNVNTGVIKRANGLSARYILDKNVGDQIIYGNLKNVELDLFGDIEIAVSEDAAFEKNLLAVRGIAGYGADVVEYHGFEIVTFGG